LALQKSQDQNIRNFAQKMITDHTAAQETLMPIAQRHNIAIPAALSPEHQGMLDRLRTMNGAAFDTAYADEMVRDHAQDLKELNDQLTSGQSQVINVWVQNTRPVVIQHYQIAEQLKSELPRAG
jgi:putative membrane protein